VAFAAQGIFGRLVWIVRDFGDEFGEVVVVVTDLG
jgi:hypothetical protein